MLYAVNLERKRNKEQTLKVRDQCQPCIKHSPFAIEHNSSGNPRNISWSKVERFCVQLLETEENTDFGVSAHNLGC